MTTPDTADPTRPAQLTVTLDDVEAAAARLHGVANRTPMQTSRSLNATLGAELWFKCEQFQRTGSFKFRGAYNALAVLPEDVRKRGVVAFSSGNHAQAMALAANVLRIPAVIVMPSDAPRVKLEATRGYGAEIVTYDRLTEDREAIGQAIAAQRNLTLIPPFNNDDVIAGQGTLALEMLSDVPDLDAIVAPVGGGGLLSGIAVAAKGLKPGMSIYGVEPETACDARDSIRAGEIVRIDPPETIADGIRTVAVGTKTFPILQQLVDDIVTVTDDEIRDALRYLAGRLKLLVEPTGAVAAAAVMYGKLPNARGKRIGVVLCGGNADLSELGSILSSSATN